MPKISVISPNYIRQSDAVLNQAGAIQNTWYTILSTVENTEIYLITISCSVADETLELEVLADGNTLTGSIAATAGTDYFTRLGYAQGNANTLNISTTFLLLNQYAPLKTKSVRVRVRKTTAGGASGIQGFVSYSKRG